MLYNYRNESKDNMTMVNATNEVVDTTRRCLFPLDVESSFESDLDSCAPMIHTTNPKESGAEPPLHSRYSPTTVFGYMPSFAMEEKLSLHSTIEMGEDGAEVTLSIAKAVVVTPEKRSNTSLKTTPTPIYKGFALGQVRNTSLMDEFGTPTPPPSKKEAGEGDHNFARAWCGNPSANCIFDDDYEVSYDANLEEIISSFLGDDSGPAPFDGMSRCYDWQEWSFSFNNTKFDTGDESIENIRLQMRQRVLNLKTRKSRVHQLRKDLSPFSKSPGRTSPGLVRSQSFSVSDHQSAIVRRSGEIHRHQNSFSKVLQLCTLPENAVAESPVPVRYPGGAHRDDVCYDSDPEDFARHRSPLRPPTNKENSHIYSFSPRIRTKGLSNEFDHSAVIHEFLNLTFTLAFHPGVSKGGDTESSSPVGVDASLERGQRLSEDLIPPKWMWRPKSRYQYKTKGTLVSAESVRSLELLDISRILKVSRVDRSVYPFAKPNKCLLVRHIDGDDFCFEAKSTEERDLIVFSLKLAIARFGAMVIASNHKIYDEFFATDNCVPGEAPEVLDMLNLTSDKSDVSC